VQSPLGTRSRPTEEDRRPDRTFPNGHEIPIATGGAEICRTVVQRNAEFGVAWVSDPYFYR
jgi:hypothetical protein